MEAQLTATVRQNRFARDLVADAIKGAFGIADEFRGALRRWFDEDDAPLPGPKSPAALEPFVSRPASSSAAARGDADDGDIFDMLAAPPKAPPPPLPSEWVLSPLTLACPPPPASLTRADPLASLPGPAVAEALAWVEEILAAADAADVSRAAWHRHAALICSLLFTYSDALRFHIVQLVLLVAGRPLSTTRRTVSALYSAHMDLPVWVSAIAPLTAASALLPLTVSEARALCDLGARFHAGRLLVGDMGAATERGPLHRLRAWADAQLALPMFAGGAFCRLSTRSPKDAAFCDDRFAAAERDEVTLLCQALRVPSPGAVPPHIAAAAEHLAAARMLRLTSSLQVVALLVRSRRAAQDLEEALALLRDDDNDDHLQGEAGAPAGDGALVGVALVLREWRPARIDSELRVFVRASVPTAVCPTFAGCFFGARPSEAWRKMGRRAVAAAMRAARAVPQRPDFVADIAFMPSTGEALIVELNAYGGLLAGTLFDWERDEALLRDGPCEFRVRADANGTVAVIDLGDLSTVLDDDTGH